MNQTLCIIVLQQVNIQFILNIDYVSKIVEPQTFLFQILFILYRWEFFLAIFNNSKGYDEVYDFIFFFNPKQVCFFIRQNGGSMFDKKAV